MSAVGPSWDLQSQLFVALQNNEVKRVENLLGQGLDPDIRFHIGSQKRPAVCLCVERGKVDLVELFLKWGCSINQSDPNGLTALHIAASHGDNKMVDVLLSNRAHVNAVTIQGHTPLHMASQRSSVDVVQKLVEAGAQLERQDNENKTALLNACIQGHAEVARYLIDQGSEVDVVSPCGNTPLLFVAIAPHLDVDLVSCLLEAGAQVNRQNLQGESAVHAVIRGHSVRRLEAIDVLLCHGCDLNLRTHLGHTPLHLAVLQRDDEAVTRLLKAGCRADPRDGLQLTPLFYAVRDGNVQTVSILLATGVRLSDQQWLWDDENWIRASLKPSLLDWLIWKSKQCLSLGEICRITIRAYLEQPVDRSVLKLSLPRALKHYLSLDTL